MTREEALARIDSIELVTSDSLEPGRVIDARRLVGILPDRALSKLSAGWIRPQQDDPSTIEFFWSRSFNMFNPGNSMTTIRTMGGGRFSVELRTSSADTFDARNWQKAVGGESLVGQLDLELDGAQALIDAVANWQAGRADS